MSNDEDEQEETEEKITPEDVRGKYAPEEGEPTLTEQLREAREREKEADEERLEGSECSEE